MPPENIIQRSFSGGEVTPAMYARVDETKYQTGLRTMRNHIGMRYGGATQRPGTQYVATTLFSVDPVRLIPFIYNETGLGQSYAMEFGDFFITFYQNGGVVIVSTAPTWNSGTAYVIGNYVTFSGVIYRCQANNTNKEPDTNPTYWDMDNRYVIPSPYAQADLPSIKFAECADAVIIVHRNYPPYQLLRLGPTNWTLTQITFGSSIGGPTGVSASGGGSGGYSYGYFVTALAANGDETDSSFGSVLVVGGVAQVSVTNPITLSWSGLAGAVSYNIYKIDSNSSGTAISSLGFIGSTTAISFVDAGITPDSNNQVPQHNTLFVGSGNYPSTVGFIQQRLAFGATDNNPVGFWLSRTGSFFNFNIHLNSVDSDPVIGSMFGQEVNQVQELLELKFMLMLTGGAEVYVQGNGTGVVTPSAVNASTQSQYGCSSLRALKIGDVLIFNQALGSFIRDFSFDFVIDGYRGNDITLFSSHLFEGHQIVDWAYQKIPDSILWVVRDDGVLLSCTYLREQQILSWARHDFVNGFVNGVCCIPENGEYAVYLCIHRHIESVGGVNYIERMDSRIWKGPAAAVANGTANALGDPIDSSNMDFYGKYDGRNTTSIEIIVDGYITIGPGNQTFTWKDASNSFSTPFSIIQGQTTVRLVDFLEGLVISMNAQSSGYSFSRSGGKVVISNSTYDFQLIASSILTLLGFSGTTGSGSMSYTAQNIPVENFSSDSNAYTQILTLTSTAALFNIGMLGDEIFIQDALFVSSQGSEGNQIRFTIQAYLSSTLVQATPNRIVPAEFQIAPTVNWVRAVKSLSGLEFLEGQQVSVWADRFLVGSPLNKNISQVYTVSDGATLTLDKCYGVIYVGLPMIADLETLAIDTSFGDSMLGETKDISQLIVYLYNSRGFWGGTRNPDSDPDNIVNGVVQDSLFNLTENKAQANRQTYDAPPGLLTESKFTNVECNWSEEGRIFIRNVDPVPLSVLAVVPSGLTSAKISYSQKV